MRRRWNMVCGPCSRAMSGGGQHEAEATHVACMKLPGLGRGSAGGFPARCAAAEAPCRVLPAKPEQLVRRGLGACCSLRPGAVLEGLRRQCAGEGFGHEGVHVECSGRLRGRGCCRGSVLGEQHWCSGGDGPLAWDCSR